MLAIFSLLVLAYVNCIAATSEDCPSIDVMFLIDSSGSISKSDYEKVREFLVMSVQGLSEDVRIAAVQYATSLELVFDFNQYTTREEEIGAISLMTQVRGGTRTGSALSFVSNNLLSDKSGNRAESADVLIVITDGRSQDSVVAPAEQLRKEGVRILAVGVDRADEAELIEITGYESLVYKVSDFESLDQDLSERLMAAAGECAPECRSEIDLSLVIDSSGSIGSSNFNTVLEFVSQIVRNIPGTSKIAALQYSTRVQPEFDFSVHQSVADAADAVLLFKYLRGQTFTGAALRYVYSNWGTGKSGNRDGVDDIVLVVTDGRATDSSSALAAAEKLRTGGSVIVAIGVGNADKAELLGLTGDADLVFMVGDFSDLNDQLMKLVMAATEVCE